MAKRRSRGDGGLHWDEDRKRWIATLTIGFDARGKRITRKRSAETKTAAKDRLKELIRDHDDGFAIAPHNYTVAEAVRYWLAYGVTGRSAGTVANYNCLAEKHIIPALGARKLRDLSTEDVDRWLARKAKELAQIFRAPVSGECRARGPVVDVDSGVGVRRNRPVSLGLSAGFHSWGLCRGSLGH